MISHGLQPIPRRAYVYYLANYAIKAGILPQQILVKVLIQCKVGTTMEERKEFSIPGISKLDSDPAARGAHLIREISRARIYP
jgi:hypothetical protein